MLIRLILTGMLFPLIQTAGLESWTEWDDQIWMGIWLGFGILGLGLIWWFYRGQKGPRFLKNVMPASSHPDTIFERLMKEVEWYEMLHRGVPVSRKVAIQGVWRADGSQPLYRYPTDEMHELKPLTPTVREIVEHLWKLGYPVNHVKIQLYESGASKIGFHTDKTLDMKWGHSFVNLSFGASRTFELQNKTTQERTSFRMVNNSAVVMDWTTNQTHKHGVEPEAGAGPRISLVCRVIDTFQTPDGRIIGQGAWKGPGDPPPEAEQRKLLRQAFGAQNREVHFDAPKHYGPGYSITGIGD